MIKEYIYITTQVEFIHRYPDAPDEVFYLRSLHRHVAHIKIKIQVFDNDREIEFIMLKHSIDEFININAKIKDATSSISCEQFSELLLDYVINNYGSHREIEIIVSEDDENGSELKYMPDI